MDDRIEAVVFDAKHTLYHGPSKATKIKSVLEKYDIYRTKEDIKTSYDKAKNLFDFFYSKGLVKKDHSGYLIETNIWLTLLDSEIPKEDIEKIHDDWSVTSEKKLFLDTLDTLEILKGKVKMGVLTASPKKKCKESLSNLKIIHYFDSIVGEDNEKPPKPDKKAYEIILDELDYKAEEVLFVGNNLVNDYLTPLEIGADAIFLDRQNKVKREDVRKISNLLEICDYISDRR